MKGKGWLFHEIVIKGNVQLRSLAIVDLEFDQVGVGYTPFRVKRDTKVERFAAGTKLPLKPSDSTDECEPDFTS